MGCAINSKAGNVLIRGLILFCPGIQGNMLSTTCKDQLHAHVIYRCSLFTPFFMHLFLSCELTGGKGQGSGSLRLQTYSVYCDREINGVCLCV